MSHRALAPLLAATLLACTAMPAAALIEEGPRWILNRRPGAALQDAPIPPFGWRLGLAAHSPFAGGLTVGYVWPALPVGVKLAATWAPWSLGGFSFTSLADTRAYGSLLYYLVPGYGGGPYFEAGLGFARSSGPAWNLGWPVLPHLGFGTTGRLNDGLGWDLSFSWVANNTFVLESALLF
jgi:hypothetical protein